MSSFVDRSTVSRNVGVLIELGLVERRGSSPADLYRINVDDPVVRALADAQRALLGSIAPTGIAGAEPDEAPNRKRTSTAPDWFGC